MYLKLYYRLQLTSSLSERGEVVMLPDEDSMVYTEALEKTYKVGSEKIEVLKDITLSIPKAKFIALRGAIRIRQNHFTKHHWRN